MKILLGPGLHDPKGNEAFLVAAMKRHANVRTFDAHGIHQQPDDWTPDAVIVRDAEYYPIMPGIENVECPIIGLVGDYNLTLPRMLPIMGMFDHIFCDLRGVELFSKLGHRNVDYFCLYGYDPGLHRDYGMPKNNDVVFVGNLNFAVQQDRARYLHDLLKLRDRYKIVIASNVYGEDYARLLNSARVVANFPVRGELNMRFFEAYGCGAVCMQPLSQELIDSGFDDYEDYTPIKDGDCESGLRYAIRYSRSDASREKFEEFTYDRQAKELISNIDALLPTLAPKARKFRIMPDVEKNRRWAQYHAPSHDTPPWDNRLSLFDPRLVRYQKDIVDNVGDIPNFNFDQWAWWIDLLLANGYNNAAQEFMAEKEDMLRCFAGFGAIKEKLRKRLNVEAYGFCL